MKNLPVRKVEKVSYLPGARKAHRHFPRLGWCLIAIALLYFAILFVSQYVRLVQLNRTLHNLEEQITIVRQQNDDMLREIERLHTPSYLEKLARQELGMVRPGELLFFFRDKDSSE